MLKIVIGILIFSLIVLIHEFGHFLFAKLNNIDVVEFSIGFGPTLIGFRHKETKYSVKLIPFGGACQMLGEDEDLGMTSDRAFNSKGVFARFTVIFAGPFFNFILAFLLSLCLVAL